MSFLSISMLISTLCFILFCSRPSIANNTNSSSFSFQHFDSKDPNFETLIKLYGDAKLVDNGNGGFVSIRLTSSGRVIYNKPIKLIEGKPKKLVSFSTHFSFSLQRGENQGLAFVLLPSDFNLTKFDVGSFGVSHKGKAKILSVKFTTLEDGSKNNDSNSTDEFVKIHVGIDMVGVVSTKVRNVSTVDLTIRNGNNKSNKSFAWVDYEASSKRLEVRISQSSGSKPSDPLFWYPIDLSKVWANMGALVGFVANSSSQTCEIHSWGFEQRHVPQWMHSEPLDPNGVNGGDDPHSKPMKIVGEKRKDCVTKILASLIFGVACGALTASTALYLWTIFGGNKRPVVPEESVDFEYNKVKVVVDKRAIEDGSSKQVGV